MQKFIFNLIRQKSSTSKVGDEAEEGYQYSKKCL